MAFPPGRNEWIDDGRGVACLLLAGENCEALCFRPNLPPVFLQPLAAAHEERRIGTLHEDQGLVELGVLRKAADDVSHPVDGLTWILQQSIGEPAKRSS